MSLGRTNRLFKLVARDMPCLVLCGDMLVVVPSGEILRGFLLEATTERNMVYLWRVVVPLYRPMRRVYLDYSTRIPNGEKLFFDQSNLTASARMFSNIIFEHLEPLGRLQKPGDFLKHIAWMMGNTFINFRFDLALTYFRTGDVEEARAILRELVGEVDHFDAARRVPIDADIKMAALRIERDPVQFGALVDQWERDNVERLGLQALPSATCSRQIGFNRA